MDFAKIKNMFQVIDSISAIEKEIAELQNKENENKIRELDVIK